MEILADFRWNPLLRMKEQRLQLLLCLLHAHAGLEPGERPHRIANSAIDRVLRRYIHLSGNNDIGSLQPGHFKVFGKDADDTHRVLVDQ